MSFTASPNTSGACDFNANRALIKRHCTSTSAAPSLAMGLKASVTRSFTDTTGTWISGKPGSGSFLSDQREYSEQASNNVNRGTRIIDCRREGAAGYFSHDD